MITRVHYPRHVRCVVIDDIEKVAEKSADWGDLDVEFVCEHLSPGELMQRLIGAEILVVMRERTPIDRAMIAQLPALRLIVTTGARNASIDLDACNDYGVRVASAAAPSLAAAQLTWALLLAAARGLPTAVEAVRQGGWWLQSPGIDLEGRRLGLIGLGYIGTAVARYGTAFGMDVVAWSPNLTHERCQESGARLVDLPELMSTSDFVSVHLVASPSTYGVVGSKELNMMRPASWLINTSRASLVNSSALVETLRNGRIAGAAIDVFDVEPPETHDPLRSLPNVIATPHIGYVTDRQLEAWYAQASRQITDFRQGLPLSRPLN